ncbi:MAG: hypothetical protein JW959_00795 [Pirellulales bacterium]|nr:hypothetical protein [Pirellulales bacterium]
MSLPMSRRQMFFRAGAAAACAALGSKLKLLAAEYEDPYPHVDAAAWYEVDPRWPRRSESAPWGAMSGAAIDRRRRRIWLFTRSEVPVQVYDAEGKYIDGWGHELIKVPHGFRLDDQDNIWITDCETHVVAQFTPKGKLLKTLGTPNVAGDDGGHFNQPTDMTITPEGEVFVADGYGNSRIVHFDRDGRFVNQWGKLGSAPGEFSIPHNIVRDSRGRLYVADRNNVRIQVFDPRGKLLDVWSNLLVPWGLCMSENDEIWACGSSPMTWAESKTPLGCPPKDQLIMRFSPSGKLLSLWTFPKGEDGQEKPGELNWLHDVAVDSQGNLYLGDIMGKRLQKFIRHG